MFLEKRVPELLLNMQKVDEASTNKEFALGASMDWGFENFTGIFDGVFGVSISIRSWIRIKISFTTLTIDVGFSQFFEVFLSFLKTGDFPEVIIKIIGDGVSNFSKEEILSVFEQKLSAAINARTDLPQPPRFRCC